MKRKLFQRNGAYLWSRDILENDMGLGTGFTLRHNAISHFLAEFCDEPTVYTASGNPHWALPTLALPI